MRLVLSLELVSYRSHLSSLSVATAPLPLFLSLHFYYRNCLEKLYMYTVACFMSYTISKPYASFTCLSMSHINCSFQISLDYPRPIFKLWSCIQSSDAQKSPLLKIFLLRRRIGYPEMRKMSPSCETIHSNIQVAQTSN